MVRITRSDLLGRSGADPFRLPTLCALQCSRTDDERATLRARARELGVAWLEFCARNDCAPIVAAALVESFAGELPAALVEWQRVLDASAQRVSVLMDQLDVVAARLDAAGVRMVALKNAGIARGIFPVRAACPMGDVDVLVSRSRFREAHALLQECGFTHAKRAEIEDGTLEQGLLDGGTEYVRRVGGEEVWLELQ